nr:MAG: hypothetical protein [Microvirus Sku113]
MEKIYQLLTFLKSLSIQGKVLSVIIILLSSIIFLFFSGCAGTIHFDKLDNFTVESKPS